MDSATQLLISFSRPYLESTGSPYDETTPMSFEYASGIIEERCNATDTTLLPIDAVFELFREMLDNLHHYTIPRRLSAIFGIIRLRDSTREIVAKIIDAHWSLYQFTDRFKLGEYLRKELSLDNIAEFIDYYNSFMQNETFAEIFNE